jgi:hypothetical protein
VTVVFTGDWMPTGGRNIRFGDGLHRFLSSADYLVANFEGVSLSPAYQVIMQQVHGEETLEALASIVPPHRVVLSCANNHAADHGFSLFEKHVRNLKSMGFIVVGSRDCPVVEPVPGIRLAALTQWSNHPGQFLADLQMEKALACDGMFNILYPHWGFELELYPRSPLVETAKNWLTRWDLVVGHHSHTPAPVAALDSPAGRKPVAFSLGDFVTCSRQRKNRWGIVVRVFLGRDARGIFRLRRLDWRFCVTVSRGRELIVRLADRCPYFPGATGP